MTIWHVTGGRPLRGRVEVQGAKNAVLPVIAASLLCPNETELTRCPALSDVDAAVDILRTLDCAVERRGDTLRIDTRNIVLRPVPRTLTGRMRSSVIFLGPILARFGEARVSVPGGCELGRRPIDLHLAALRALGAEIREEGDAVCCRAASLRGAEIPLRCGPGAGDRNAAGISALAWRDDLRRRLAGDPCGWFLSPGTGRSRRAGGQDCGGHLAQLCGVRRWGSGACGRGASADDAGALYAGDHGRFPENRTG